MIEEVMHPDDFEGSQAELYMQLADVGESQFVHRAVASGASILELGCGTGRMTRACSNWDIPSPRWTTTRRR